MTQLSGIGYNVAVRAGLSSFPCPWTLRCNITLLQHEAAPCQQQEVLTATSRQHGTIAQCRRHSTDADLPGPSSMPITSTQP